jgi:hypothetical protein
VLVADSIEIQLTSPKLKTSQTLATFDLFALAYQQSRRIHITPAVMLDIPSRICFLKSQTATDLNEASLGETCAV